MADGAVISISTVVWEKKLGAYMREAGLNLRQALSEEFPLLVRKVIDFTPPFKAGGCPGASDYSVGRKAVATDIAKVMRPFDPTTIRMPALEKVVRDQNIEAFNIIADRSSNPLLRGAKAVRFSPQLHTNARNARGRVTGHSRNQVVLGSDAQLLSRYVKDVQARVGFAKSGWAAAYNLVRDPEGQDLPQWVRNKGTAGGTVIDDRANEDYPSITGLNHTPWAVRQDEGERARSSAYASRAQALTSKITTMIRLARQKSGFSAA